ncbi:MAG TPA: cytochrome c [Sinorhizobium sp.]|nr:cytochrome c [Sinorhizobium sp.]
MARIAGLLSALMILGASLDAQAGDSAAGQAKSAPCFVCHGKNGIGTAPNFPNLAGQKSQYMIQQLRLFRSGERKSEQMNIVAQPLSDEDIADLSAYYESLSPGGS